MTTATRLVEDCVRSDSVTREALARGIVNYRALAEWLIHTFDLETSPASVVSALRRLNAADVDEAFSEARRVLRASYLNSRARRSRFVVPNTQTVQERLPALLKSIDYSKGETIRVLSFDGGFKIVLDETNFERACTILGKSMVDDVRHGLVELMVVMPRASQDVPGIYALLANALALRRISIEEGWISFGQEVILVREEDLLDAYDALAGITAVSGSHDKQSCGDDAPPHPLKEATR